MSKKGQMAAIDDKMLSYHLGFLSSLKEFFSICLDTALFKNHFLLLGSHKKKISETKGVESSQLSFLPGPSNYAPAFGVGRAHPSQTALPSWH